MENQNKKFNLKYFILFAVIDFITLGFGGYFFSIGLGSCLRDNRGVGEMGIGGVLIVLFFLIRLWRKEYRERNSDR
ncbi:hypothetical protein ACE193_04345 [Bernardetia sp. OM2101]|uniref:hypothetical protein n=1 Tax=Bernardetia sp. OM2101 TaxID=3344876 RepID=UPI0035CEB4C7